MGEFSDLMMSTNQQSSDGFYSRYVADIQARIIQNADLEFQCLRREHLRTKKPMVVLTNMISERINDLQTHILESRLFDQTALRNAGIREYLPQSIVQSVGFDNIMHRVPESYLRHIFAGQL